LSIRYEAADAALPLDSRALPRSTPEKMGLPSEAIERFLDGLEELGLVLHGLVLARHGHVVAEGWWAPYRPDYPHLLNSFSKSVTSTAIGIAQDEGLLSVNDAVVSFFADELDEAKRAEWSALTVEDLLTMRSGHGEDTLRIWAGGSLLRDYPAFQVGDRPDRDWVKGFFDVPAACEPGTRFVYNSGATYMLSAIVTKVTGQSLTDYLYPRLFEPLGIARPQWEKDPSGIECGGWGLRLTTESMAKFAMLMLQKGVWEGRRIVSESWVEVATSNRTNVVQDENVSDSEQGYGYQFWQSRHGGYRADGAFGQFGLVMPGADAVIAITAGTNEMHAIMNLIWDRLLPVMADGEREADEEAHARLVRRLAALSVAPEEASSAADGGETEFKGTRVYRMDDNEDGVKEIALTFGEGELTFEWSDAHGESSLSAGFGHWIDEPSELGEVASVKAEWTGRDTLRLDVCRVNTPYHDTLDLSFDGPKLTLRRWHLDFNAIDRTLTGTLLRAEQAE